MTNIYILYNIYSYIKILYMDFSINVHTLWNKTEGRLNQKTERVDRRIIFLFLFSFMICKKETTEPREDKKKKDRGNIHILEE